MHLNYVGERLVPDDPGTGVYVAVDRRKNAVVVDPARVGEGVMRLMLFDPPGRAEPLKQRHQTEHEARFRVVAWPPMVVGEVVTEKRRSGIVQGEHKPANDRRHAAHCQEGESERWSGCKFDATQRLFPRRDVEVAFFTRQRLEGRHALRKRSSVRTAQAA